MPRAERLVWAREVAAALPTGNVTFFLHAGRRYAEFLEWRAEWPVRGLGIGQQLAWYKAKGF